MTDLANLRRRVNRARRFPENTCPASRHIHQMAEILAKGGVPAEVRWEREYCAESMLSVLESLFKLRTEKAKRHD